MTKSKTIREAIHGDIMLHAHELDVVNTRVFQRLHGVKQLGMAFVVYPTATHTRFQHSLGCVHVAQKIIDQLNRDGERVLPDLQDKIRMAALLHDIAHVPYGHTLENELLVLKERHDETPERLARFFTALKSEIKADPRKDARAVLPLIDYAARVIRTIKQFDDCIKRRQSPIPGQIELPADEWFVADIIGNTICADLLDYVRRDIKSTGLNQDYDDRIYSYFDLASDGRGTRLALRATKDQGLRLDAISEILHVLRMRYTLSERVLFHHTKNVASAMLGEVVARLDLPAEALDELSDAELLPHLRRLSQERPTKVRKALQRLIDALETRRLHKTIFRVGLAQQAPYQLEKARHLGEDYMEVASRHALEERMRKMFPMLRMGDVIVYSPEPKMTMKEVWVNVVVRNEATPLCRPLRQEAAEGHPYLPAVVADEVKEIEDKYSALWSWSMFLAQDKMNYCFAIQAFLREELNVSNDPFLQGYLDKHPSLTIGRAVRDRAPREVDVQAKAIHVLSTGYRDLQRAAAAGEPAVDDEIQLAVDRARRVLHGAQQPAR